MILPDDCVLYIMQHTWSDPAIKHFQSTDMLSLSNLWQVQGSRKLWLSETWVLEGPMQTKKISLIQDKNDNNNLARHMEFRLCSHLRLVHLSTCFNHEVAIEGKTSWKTPGGKLPNMVYTGLCCWTGMIFILSILNRVYNFVWVCQQGICMRDWFDLVDEICLYSMYTKAMTITWKQDGVHFVRCLSIKISKTFTFLLSVNIVTAK